MTEELTAAQCADLIGVTPSTWRAYVSRAARKAVATGQPPSVPQPIKRYGGTVAGTPVWDRRQVEDWHRGRRGPGNRTPRTARESGSPATATR